MKAAAGAGSHEAQVVAYLAELNGETLEGCGIAHVCAGVGRCFYEVGSLLEGVAGVLAHAFGTQFGKARNGVEAGSDGGSAHVDFFQQHHVALQVCNLLLEVVGECMELLAGGHGNGILQLCAAHLDYVGELVALCAEAGYELLEAGLDVAVHAHESIAECGGISIVGALGAVHMVVGGAVLVLALVVAHEFEGAVRDNFVCVHVHGSTGAALHHVNGELVMELAVHYLLASLDYGIADLAVQYAQVGVGAGGSHLYVGHCHDVLGIVVHVGG